jgi:hypothetical protein
MRNYCDTPIYVSVTYRHRGLSDIICDQDTSTRLTSHRASFIEVFIDLLTA